MVSNNGKRENCRENAEHLSEEGNNCLGDVTWLEV